jgi:recombination protein RecA
LSEDVNPAEANSVDSVDVREVVDEICREDLAPCTQWLSTGCSLLDLAIANRLPGGFGVGRVSHIYGEEAAAKSVLVQEALGSAQRQGGIAYYEDAEQTLDLERASLFGLDVQKSWRYQVPTSVEELFDDHIKNILKDRRSNSKPGAVGIDSLSALPSKVEQEEKLGNTGYGVSRAKIISAAFRKYLAEVSRKNLALIFVDQERDNVGVMYGDSSTVSGGRALKFYASTRVQVHLKKKILNSRGIAIGVVITFNVVKNKIAPPYRSGELRVIFDYGVDDIGSSLEWLREHDIEQYSVLSKEEREKKEERTRYYLFGEHKEKGLEAMTRLIEEKHYEDQLRQRLETVWREVYRTPSRAAKKRWN